MEEWVDVKWEQTANGAPEPEANVVLNIALRWCTANAAVLLATTRSRGGRKHSCAIGRCGRGIKEVAEEARQVQERSSDGQCLFQVCHTCFSGFFSPHCGSAFALRML